MHSLVEKGFVIPSSSAIAAPVLFVGKEGAEKGSGDLRLVISYREPDKMTPKVGDLVPRIRGLIGRLRKAAWFSKLGLTSGYYRVQVAEADQWKTTFRAPYGTYQFRVMPFGLAGAPPTFQGLVQNFFMSVLDEFVVVYLADVLIYCDPKELHFQHLSLVFHKTREARLSARLSKCELVTQRVR